MSKLTNYNGIEAANLFLGQAGFDSMTGSIAVLPDGFKRWVAVLVLQESGGSNIVLGTEVGDDLTINGAWVTDLVGTIIYGPFNSVNAGGHDIIAYRG